MKKLREAIDDIEKERVECFLSNWNQYPTAYGCIKIDLDEMVRLLTNCVMNIHIIEACQPDTSVDWTFPISVYRDARASQKMLFFGPNEASMVKVECCEMTYYVDLIYYNHESYRSVHCGVHVETVHVHLVAAEIRKWLSYDFSTIEGFFPVKL